MSDLQLCLVWLAGWFAVSILFGLVVCRGFALMAEDEPEDLEKQDPYNPNSDRL